MSAPASFLESLSPWGGSRSATPKQPAATGEDGADGAAVPPPPQQQGGDHRVSPRYRVNPKEYGPDCPPLKVCWFYATDIHKRRPQGVQKNDAQDRPSQLPKKYTPFSARDSQSIELAFQKLAEEEDRKRGHVRQPSDTDRAVEAQRGDGAGAIGEKVNTSLHTDGQKSSMKVPVNDDFLFDVDVDARELAPAYWLGPIYAVRRGTWFYAEGGGTRPCDENLATQLESGYVKTKAWQVTPQSQERNDSGSRPRPVSWVFGERSKATSPDKKDARDATLEKPKDGSNEPDKLSPVDAEASKAQLKTHRLFGSHMNSIVTYQDGEVAWLLTDDYYSRMTSAVYQRLAGGGHLGGVKLIRGYTEPGKGRTAKGERASSVDITSDGERGRSQPQHRKQLSDSAAFKNESKASEAPKDDGDDSEAGPEPQKEHESTRKLIEKQISRFSGLGTGITKEDAAAQEEETRQKEEKEMRDDYKDSDEAEQDRQIEHLVLVTHGIGQRLGLRLQALNFIHDVNVLRKSLKDVYAKSPDLQTLNDELDNLPKNCRIQVLPVVWRHLLDFPHQSFKENKEKDVSDESAFTEELGYPNLKDITIEGITPVRNLVEDLFLDILLYQSDYRDRIVHIIRKECNRIYSLFCERNPTFNGKVSLIGHSLGSALFFDLLCHQPTSDMGKSAKSPFLQRSQSINKFPGASDLALYFDVEDMYCLGSPIGLFQMIKGKSVSARQRSTASSNDPEGDKNSVSTVATSSPKCKQLYNIFHPTDPVAYRMEPLISAAMKDLKPQPLPYVKKGMFDVPADGFSGISTRVGQSMTGLWSSVTTGVASSIINRSLGLQAAPSKEGEKGFKLINLASRSEAGGSDQNTVKARANSLSLGDISAAGEDGETDTDLLEHPPTLIDSKLETLYSGFQRRRSQPEGSQDSPQELSAQGASWSAAEDKARSLRQEEAKIRALNANGRVDYSIQEGVFDITLIGSIASHLSYWGDEDVNHFIISQLLARQRVVKHDE